MIPRYLNNPSSRGSLLLSEVADEDLLSPPAMRGQGRMVWANPFRRWTREAAEPAGWFPDMGAERNWVLRWMPPREFLASADPKWDSYSEEMKSGRVQSVVQAVEEGVVFAPLMLDPGRARPGGGMYHEGRHRAEAAYRMGDPIVPVLVSVKHLR